MTGMPRGQFYGLLAMFVALCLLSLWGIVTWL